MRLLELKDSGEFGLTRDLIDDIPPYAILSHTWGPESDTDEVSYGDVMERSGKSKAGYAKIQFCGEQARRDGLQYFWVDTCCIDKSNSSELTEAINSMFRWYLNAAKCYAYLSDVPRSTSVTDVEYNQRLWEADFRKSRWFTRGWTLQELLAPDSVEFFSRQGKRLGDKKALKQQIHEITGISIRALQGTPLSEFKVDDRLAWAQKRETTRKEDEAYSLLGIFNVYMQLIYGEGRENAFRRLREEIDKPSSGLDSLLGTSDPQITKDRIELSKDKLLKHCCSWILEDSNFRRWRDSKESRLLWIKGDPGKGKTMMMIALADDLKGQPNTVSGMVKSRAFKKVFMKRGPRLVSYFFCQNTDSGLNSAVSVLKGLIYRIVQQRNDMIRHVRRRCVDDGSGVFKGPDAVYNLRIALRDILNDSTLPETYLLIDALDECNEGLQQLLDTINDQSFAPTTKVKWIVASRNRPEITEMLRPDGARINICLELNAEHVMKAVGAFVDTKMRDLALRKRYDAALENKVRVTLLERSEATFFWASLACKRLEKVPASEALTVLEELPAGLDELYKRMLRQLLCEPSRLAGHCKQILCSAAVAYRPFQLRELAGITGLPDKALDDVQYITELSAKDYLSSSEGQELVDWDPADQHGKAGVRSLNLLSKFLTRDIGGLQEPGSLASEAKSVSADSALLKIEYACCHWVDHLCDYLADTEHSRIAAALFSDGGKVHEFLQIHFLHWLEALSLLKRLSEAVEMSNKLLSAVKVAAPDTNLLAFVEDACRFLSSSQTGIELAPLQVYSAALIFAPSTSIVRSQFSDQIPSHFKRLTTTLEGEMPKCTMMRTLEGHSNSVVAVAFRQDGSLLASADDETVRLWDVGSGAAQLLIKRYQNPVTAVGSWLYGKLMASISDKTDVWDSDLGEVRALAFSPDEKLLALGSTYGAVEMRHLSSDAAMQTLKTRSFWANALAFSPDSKLLATGSGSNGSVVELWDVGSGTVLQSFGGHSTSIEAVVFSPDSKLLASVSEDGIIKLWDTSSGAVLQTLQTRRGHVRLVFLSKGNLLASASGLEIVDVWDTHSGAAIQRHRGSSPMYEAVAFSPDGKLIASSIWTDVNIGLTTSCRPLRMLEGHSQRVNDLAFSSDSRILASASADKTVRLWDTGPGVSEPFESHLRPVHTLTFSPDGKLLASGSDDGTIVLWDAGSGAALHMLRGHLARIRTLAFSPAGQLLASAADRGMVRLWDVDSGVVLQKLDGHWKAVNALSFSPNGKLLASGSNDGTVILWDAGSGALLQSQDFGAMVETVSIPDNGSYIDTEHGRMHVDVSWTSPPSVAVVPAPSRTPSTPHARKPYLTIVGGWIWSSASPILWLPPEYQPTCSVVNGSVVGLGHSSGRVSILEFDFS